MNQSGSVGEGPPQQRAGMGGLPGRERVASVVGCVVWRVKRTDQCEADIVGVDDVAVPSTWRCRRVRAELDDIAEMDEWREAPASAVRAVGPEPRRHAPGLRTSGQRVAVQTFAPG